MKRVIRVVRRRVLDSLRCFASRNDYRGVYQSFAEASRLAPKARPIGYDQPCVASWYREKLKHILHDDYPALFWMSMALKDAQSVYEIGGHVGLAFYGFERHLCYPSGLNWTICEVPAVVTEGRRLAHERGRDELRFVTSLTEFSGADIVLAAGSLQYVESPDLAETINGFSHKLGHVLINKTPVWDGPRFVTLQNLGCFYCPYLIRNRKDFVLSIELLGYELVDSWQKERFFRLLWHRDKAFDHYSGFYFRKVN
jgi:putative methyltransferase (TIGR04325 family)